MIVNEQKKRDSLRDDPSPSPTLPTVIPKKPHAGNSRSIRIYTILLYYYERGAKGSSTAGGTGTCCTASHARGAGRGGAEHLVDFGHAVVTGVGEYCVPTKKKKVTYYVNCGLGYFSKRT